MYGNTIRLKPSNCFPIPDGIDLKTGATILVNYLTAYFSVMEMGNLKDNETILILSCTGELSIRKDNLNNSSKFRIFGMDLKWTQYTSIYTWIILSI